MSVEEENISPAVYIERLQHAGVNNSDDSDSESSTRSSAVVPDSEVRESESAALQLKVDSLLREICGSAVEHSKEEESEDQNGTNPALPVDPEGQRLHNSKEISSNPPLDCGKVPTNPPQDLQAIVNAPHFSPTDFVSVADILLERRLGRPLYHDDVVIDRGVGQWLMQVKELRMELATVAMDDEILSKQLLYVMLALRLQFGCDATGTSKKRKASRDVKEISPKKYDKGPRTEGKAKDEKQVSSPKSHNKGHWTDWKGKDLKEASSWRSYDKGSWTDGKAKDWKEVSSPKSDDKGHWTHYTEDLNEASSSTWHFDNGRKTYQDHKDRDDERTLITDIIDALQSKSYRHRILTVGEVASWTADDPSKTFGVRFRCLAKEGRLDGTDRKWKAWLTNQVPGAVVHAGTNKVHYSSKKWQS